MDPHFDCRAEVIENDEMDQQFVCDAEIYNSIEYNRELVDKNSDTTVPKRISFNQYIVYCFIVFVFLTPIIFVICTVLFIKSPDCRVGWSKHDMTCYNFDVGGNFSWSECKSECTPCYAYPILE